MKPVLIIGAGGHAKVVADALLASGREVLGFTSAEPNAVINSEVLPGLHMLGSDDVLRKFSPVEIDLVNGLGGVDCRGLRRQIQSRLESAGWFFSGVQHPTALISPFAKICDGVHLLAASVVQAGALIGAGSIINTAAVVEHDCVLGEFIHVAPHALICGNTQLGGDSHVGAGSTVVQGLILGPQTLIGAGAVVVKNFNGSGILMGVPARSVD